MNSASYFEKIRQFVSNDDLDAAIKLLSRLLKNVPALDEAILQSARWNDLKRQIRLDQLHYETAQVSKNQIRAGILELLRDIEEQAAETKIKAETEAYLQSIQISGKNIISSSTIQAGGSVTIGDQHIQHITESKTSRVLRLFLFVFVPILAIAVGVLSYQYLSMQRPLQLDVSLDNQTPNPNLPYEGGTVILQYDNKRDTQSITTEAVFKAIPPNNRHQTVRLQFEAKGFATVDTSFTLDQASIVLPIRRDDTYARLFGTVTDEEGQAVAGAQVSVEDIQMSMTTGQQGQFYFQIPLPLQKPSHRLKVQKEGYQVWDREEAVIPHESTPVQLIKN